MIPQKCVGVPVDSPVQDDPWALPEFVAKGKPWKEMTSDERIKSVVVTCAKIVTLFLLLYLFICSLDFLSNSFRLIGGRTASQVFSNSELLKNPIVGLMMGCLVTVLVQSSSTSTSIIVSMVASGLLAVRTCIPMIMGANIGTSITNTLVSLTQVTDRNEFRRAFGGATVHDMFNWLNVIVLLLLEVMLRKINPSGQGYLEYITDAILNSTEFETNKGAKFDLLKTITKPLTSVVVKIDKRVLHDWALNNNRSDNKSLIKHFCGTERCHSLFSYSDMKDVYVGLIMLIVSLILLCGCLIMMVKLLHSMLQGAMAVVIRKTLNANIPYVPWLTGYLAIVVGCGMTILVQSSSVFTSAMTPLVGVGVISLERMYPLTLGSNIGTTTTAILAAFAASGDLLRLSLQIALVHFFFNISGIMLFYVVPFTRWPIPMARALGNTTAQYRWFAVAYLLFMFVVAPVLVFALSLAGASVLYTVIGAGVLLTILVIGINMLQLRAPHLLPSTLRSWCWLPEWLRSLDPYDRAISATWRNFHCCCRGLSIESDNDNRKMAGDVPAGKYEDPVQHEKKRAQLQFQQRGIDNGGLELGEVPANGTSEVYRSIAFH